MAGNDLSGIQVPTSPSPLPFLPYFCLPPSLPPLLPYFCLPPSLPLLLPHPLLHSLFPFLPPPSLPLPPSSSPSHSLSPSLPPPSQLLEEETPWLTRARQEVESQSKRMVMQGLEMMVSHFSLCHFSPRVWQALPACLLTSPSPSQNPFQVGVSLQVFYNVGQLPPTLHALLTSFRDAIQHIQNALDPTTLMVGRGE